MSIDPAKAVELYAAVHLTVIGLSHVLQPAAWARFFELLRSHGASGAFANGFLSLMFGSIIVAFHNIWEGGAIVLTCSAGHRSSKRSSHSPHLRSVCAA